MENKESVLSLLRVCTQRDKDNKYVLNSKDKKIMPNEQALQEIISHELDATTGRGVFYSFTTDLELARRYKLRNPENTEICCIDIDLANLPAGVKSIFPIYSRDYLMCLMCSTPEVLLEGKVQNPATGREHSFLGILNTSQRTVSGWANSMKEIVIQTDNLQLQVLDESSYIPQDEETVDRIVRKYLFPKVSPESVKRFRDIIASEFYKAGCKRRYLLDRVNGEEWAKVA